MILDENCRASQKKILGVVLDISHRECDGLSRVGLVKDGVASVVNGIWSPDDLVYIAHDPDDDRMPDTRAEGTAWVQNFVATPDLDAVFLFKHTVNSVVLAEADERYVAWVSDRFRPNQAAHFAAHIDAVRGCHANVRFGLFDISEGRHPIDDSEALTEGRPEAAIYGQTAAAFADRLADFLTPRAEDDHAQRTADPLEFCRTTEGGEHEQVPGSDPAGGR